MPTDLSTVSAVLSVRDAAAFLGVSKSFLDKARCTGSGPAFTRVGRRIKYRLPTLEAYLAANERNSTCEPA